jgi:hypothetical protein
MGCKPVRSKTGGPVQVNTYLNSAVAIYPGDIVKLDETTGNVAAITAVSDIPFGVAATYVSATVDQEVQIYDDLQNTIFEIQVDDDSISADTTIGALYDVAAIVTGDTVRVRSQHELDGDGSTNDTFMLLGKAERPGNDWGEFVNVLVQFMVSKRAIERS